MPENKEIPLMTFEADASAPILRYDIPSPSSYEGRNYIELFLEDNYFKREAFYPPKGGINAVLEKIMKANRIDIHNFLLNATLAEVKAMMIDFDINSGEGNRVTIGNKSYEILFLSGGTIDPGEDPEATGPVTPDVSGGSVRNQNDTVETEGSFDNSEPFQLPLPPRRYPTGGSNNSDVIKEYEYTKKYNIFKHGIEAALSHNKYPIFYKSQSGKLRIDYFSIPENEDLKPRLMFIETYKLTSFAGDYGAGNTIKTFSLLPAEETEISIKTWKKSRTTVNEASSVLDSYTSDTADEFEAGIQNESSDTSKVEKTSSYHAEAKASGGWGWGSAEASAGKAGSSNFSREDFSKNVMNATEKHSQSASSKREINVDTSYEREDEQGEEITIMRRIKNLNASRTLNFVFRQMNQEFHSILHLTDVRVAFFNGFPGTMQEYTLNQLDQLVSSYMVPQIPTIPNTVVDPDSNRDTLQYLKSLVLGEYGENTVIDYKGNPQTLVEDANLSYGNQGKQINFLRVIPSIKKETLSEQENPWEQGKQEYVMRDNSINKKNDVRYLDGVILDARKITMRTDGVIIESLLGQAEALDAYSRESRYETVREKRLTNNKIDTGLELVNKLTLDGKVEEAAKLYSSLFGPNQNVED